MILALDTALKTGWAVGCEGVKAFGLLNFSEYTHDYALVGRHFRAEICKLITEYEPSELVLEAPMHFPNARRGATTILHGLAWEAHRAAQLRGIIRHEYYPITIKKSFTGNARAKKPEMIAEAKNRGFNVVGDNDADAIALLLLHQSRIKE